jgi:hypothetical protein
MALPPSDALQNAAFSLGAPVQSQAAIQTVNAEPGASFLYSFPPESFQLLEVPKGEIDGFDCPGGKFWLPTQVRIVNAPGANQVRVIGPGEHPSEAWRYVVQNAREKGHVLLSPDLPIPAAALPSGAQPGGYLREAAVRWRGQMGVRYVTPWDLCTPLPGDAPARWSFDRSNYALWLWWLVAAGHVPGVHPAYIDGKKADMRGAVAQVEARVINMPADQAKRRIEEVVAEAATAEKAEVAGKVERASVAKRGKANAA